MLDHVIQLVFKRATDEAAWSEMYVQLIHKYLLNRCQGDFECRWFANEATAALAAAKTSNDYATKAANNKKSMEEGHMTKVYGTELPSTSTMAASNGKMYNH
ncbi:hypothetical protein BDR06DRAFT_976612 [Suillus hirtellus]|nr:hypothetical protein BDR06DRAFT_976612 [Suillus hirtellus]